LARAYYEGDISASELSGALWTEGWGLFHDVKGHVERGKEYNRAIRRCGNCKVYPHNDGFDERWFLEQVEEDDDLTGDVLPRVAGGIDTWVKEVYRWYKERL
jgi:hypothetical protein